MHLIETEVARWQRDGFLHLPGLLPPVARERIRRWVLAASTGSEAGSLAEGARGLSARSAASLASHHTGLARVLGRGLLPELGAQLLGGPCRPAELPGAPTARQVTCVVALDDQEDQPFELMGGHHDGGEPDASEPWQTIQLGAGDLLWVHGLTPRRGRPSRALFLEYRALDTQTTFGWSDRGYRAGA